MEHKNLVIKSKSSNSAMTPKPAPDGGAGANKKSWSSARFGEVNSKKRGVYVEKKSTTNTLMRVAPGPSDVPKAPKRPRRGEKNFLNSCLSILSQETTATQFPENGNLKSGKGRRNTRKPAAETVDKGTQDLDAIYSVSNLPERNKSNTGRRAARNPPPSPPKQRKPRFRSKALCENFNDNKLVILQHKKAFPRSPSMNSSGGIKSAEGRQGLSSARPSLLAHTSHENKIEDKKDEQKNERCENKKSDHSVGSKDQKVLQIEVKDSKVASSVHEDVKSTVTAEAKKSKKVLRIEEPNTLVSDYSSKNKSLYNFFVDLLETTCDVYNVQPDCKRPPSPKFQIDDVVAQKLQINEPNPVNKSGTNFETGTKFAENIKNGHSFSNNINVNKDAPKKLYFVTDDGVTDKIAVYQAGPNCYNWNPPNLKPKRYISPYKPNLRRTKRETYGNDYRSNLKSESFRFAQQLKIQEAARAESFLSPKKRFGLKRNKKRSLLSLLKEELQFDVDYFEEPASFHQALSIIARNKRRTQREIHRDDSSVKFSVADRKSRAGSSECFKRRKVISASTKSPRRTKRNSYKNKLPRDISVTVFPEGPVRNNTYESDESSVHSIEVSAYNYAPNQYVRRLETTTNECIYSTNSGISLRSETITSSKDYLECLQKCGRSLSPSDSATASTAISQLLLRDVYNTF